MRRLFSPGYKVRKMLFVLMATMALLMPALAAHADPDTGTNPEIWYVTSGTPDTLSYYAQALNKPVLMYEFLRNNAEYTLYDGSRSGSTNTFMGLRGNDVDLASALIAMLRQQGYHSRYVVGTIKVGSSQVMNWLGVKNVNLAVKIMQTQGIQKVTLNGDNTVSFEHVWVEVQVPFGEYRGAGAGDSLTNTADCATNPADCHCGTDSSDCHWIALDPSFKQRNYNDQGVDPSGAVQFDYTNYYNAISNANNNGDTSRLNKNPLEIYQNQVLDWLHTNYAGKTLDDASYKGPVIREDNWILPASLPYTVIGTPRRYNSVTDHDKAVPATETYKWTKYLNLTLSITLYDQNNNPYPNSFSLVNPIPLAQLSTYPLVVSTKKTAAGIPNVILNYGIPSQGGYELGTLLTENSISGYTPKIGDGFSLSINVDGPAGSTPQPVEYDYFTIGGYYLIATGGETSNWTQVISAADSLLTASQQQIKIVYNTSEAGCQAPPAGTGVGCTPYVDKNGTGVYAANDPKLEDDQTSMDSLTDGLLYVAAMQYYAQLRDNMKAADALNRTITPISYLVGVVSSGYDAVEYINGTAFSILPGGLLLDMKGTTLAGSWRIDQPNQWSNSQMNFIGHISSSLEHETWQQLTGYDAISTVRGIQMALANGATLTNPKKNSTSDTLPGLYGTYGFSSSAPSGFAQHSYSIFGKTYYTWTNSNSSAGFMAFRPNTQGLSSSDPNTGYGEYDVIRGYDSFFSGYDSLENELISAQATESQLYTNMNASSQLTNYTSENVLKAYVESPAGFSLGGYSRIDSSTYNYVVNETTNHADGSYPIWVYVYLGNPSVIQGLGGCGGQGGTLSTVYNGPAGFAIDPSTTDGKAQPDSNGVIWLKINQTASNPDGNYTLHIRIVFRYMTYADFNVPVTVVNGGIVTSAGDFQLATVNVQRQTSITCNGATYTGLPSALLGNLQNCFNTSVSINNLAPSIAFFDPTAPLVYRSLPAANDNQFTGHIVGIRNDLYSQDLSKGWAEYLLPSKLTVGPYYRFEVDIRKNYDTSNNMNALYFGIQNDYGVSAGGGYVQENGPLVQEATSIVQPGASNVVPTFNNAVLTDKNTIAQTNNDQIKTPSTVDPASVVTGNNYHDETDLAIKGRGINIALTRTYNSAPSSSSKDGPFGYGWTHSYNMTLKSNDYGSCPNCTSAQAAENGNGKTSSITYTDERGGEHNYLVNESNYAVTRPTGEFDTLQFDYPSAGYHTITFRNGVQYVFQGSTSIKSTPALTATLYQIKDPYGNVLTFSYMNGNLTAVTDNLGLSGRTGLSITYYPSSIHIKDITDWTGRKWSYAYDSYGNLQSVTNPLTNAIIYSYTPTSSHNLSSVLLPEKRIYNNASHDVITWYAYYQNGKTFANMDGLNNAEVMGYDLYRKITSVTDPRGYIRQYEFDQNGLLTKLTEPDDGILQFSNTPDFLRYQKIDALGYKTSYSYKTDHTFGTASDTGGNVTMEQDPLSNTLQYTYGIYDQIATMKDKNGNTFTMTYYTSDNPATGALHGKLQSVTLSTLNGLSSVLLRSYAYNTYGTINKMIEYIDPSNLARQRITNYTWQDNGLNLQSVAVSGATSGTANTTSFTYDTLGRKHTATLTRRNSYTDSTLVTLTTTYDYDALDHLTKTTDTIGNSVESVYDKNGKVSKVNLNYLRTTGTIDQRIASQRFYDADDHLIADYDIFLDLTQYGYDSEGNLGYVIDPNGNATQFVYDPMNRRTMLTDANGYNWKTVYDQAGRAVQSINPLGKTVMTDYDALGRPITITSAMGGKTTFTYDGNGNMKKMTDANANAGLQPKNSYGCTLFKVYDELNRVKQEVSAVDGVSDAVTSYTYDLLGNITSITDAENHITYFDYDDMGRLIKVRDPLYPTTSKATVFTYDEAGNLLSRTNRSGAQAIFTYDLLNRRTTAQYTSTAGTFTETTTYDIYGNKRYVSNPDVTYHFTYDLMNRLSAKTDNRNNKTIIFTYDHAGNIINKLNYDGTNTKFTYDSTNRLISEQNADYLEVSYHYDGAGRLLNRILSNGAHTDYTWDDDNRLTSLKNTSANGTIVSNTTYNQRDWLGNIKQQTDASGTTSFAYDALYRLTSADYSGTSNDQSFTYDKAGNRKTWTKNGNTLAYVYDVDNRMKEIHQTTVGGTLLNSYVYDDDGNMTTKKNGVGTTIQSLTFDPKGRTKTITTSGIGTVTQLTYDPFDYRIYKYDSQGNQTYLLEGERIDAIMSGLNWQAKFMRGSVIDEVVNGFEYNASGVWTNYTFHHDNLQSVLGLTGHEGSVLQAISYGPFGEKIATTGAANNNYLHFTGREEDPDSGLYYFRARYYDPAVGRFITEDPKGFDAGVNFYAYAQNNPINANDPYGLETWSGMVNLNLNTPFFQGGGGTALNFGVDNHGRVSFSITGTFGGGAGTGAGASLGLTGSYTNSSNGVDSLLGSGTVEASRSLNSKWTGTGIFNEGYEGGAVTFNLRGLDFTDPAISARAGVSVTNTSAIVQYQDGKLEFLKPGNGPAALTIPIFPTDTPDKSTGTPKLNLSFGDSSQAAAGGGGGFVIYPNKANLNMMRAVYRK